MPITAKWWSQEFLSSKSLISTVKEKEGLCEGLSHLPVSSLPDFRLYCFLQPLPFHMLPLWESNYPGLGNQQTPFLSAVVYLKGIEIHADPVSDLNLESLIVSGGAHLVALGALRTPIS